MYFHNPDRQIFESRLLGYVWDIDLAQKLLQKRNSQEIESINVESTYNSIQWAVKGSSRIPLFGSSVDPEYTLKTDLTKPLIFGLVKVQGSWYRILIDGHHRLYRAFQEGVQELPAYYLTKAENRKTVISDKKPPVKRNPQELCPFCSSILPELELEKLLHLLKNHKAIIGYHGTTVELAEEILAKGFRLPPISEIIKNAYQACGIDWATRNKFPKWAREYMEHEGRHRIAIEKYKSISFAPKEVSRRWAGWGGEVLHEMVRNIEVIKAFWATNLPKTEAIFDTWTETQKLASFYRHIGEPAILKALIVLKPEQAENFAHQIETIIKWSKEDNLDPFKIWDNDYKDYKVYDPKQILSVEIEEPNIQRNPIQVYGWVPDKKILAKWSGAKIGKPFGCELFGCVFKTNIANTVLKVTRDAEEVAVIKHILALREQGEILPGFVQYVKGPEEIKAKQGSEKVYVYLRQEITPIEKDIDDGLFEIHHHTSSEYAQDVGIAETGHYLATALYFVSLIGSDYIRDYGTKKYANVYTKWCQKAAQDFPEIAASLLALAKKGIYLTDVDVSNIGVNSMGTPVLFDFRLASIKNRRNPETWKFLGIKPSNRPGKKYMASFKKGTGRVKTTHFGASGMSDYTKHRDPARQKRYLRRHSARENWKDPTTAGALSRWILWNKPSLKGSITDYKRRFGFHSIKNRRNPLSENRIVGLLSMAVWARGDAGEAQQARHLIIKMLNAAPTTDLPLIKASLKKAVESTDTQPGSLEKLQSIWRETKFAEISFDEIV